jgi:hypothetical protein
VAANIAAAEPNLAARIVAAWPAVALLLVVEKLTKSQPASRNDHRTSDAARPQQPPAFEAASAPPLKSHPSDFVTEVKQAQHAGVAEIPTCQVSASLRWRNARRKRVTRRAERTADVVARLRAERPQASLAEVALAAGVPERHVRRLAAVKPENTGQPADGS